MGGPAPSVQFSWDGPGALGAGDDGKALCWDQSSGRFVLTAKAAAAHTHAPSDISQGGATSGQALLWDGAAWTPATLPEGVTDHGELSGLADDDHAQYIVLAPGDSTRNVLQPSGAAIKPLVVKGAASQSANLLELQNSAGTALAYMNPSGTIYAPNGYPGTTPAMLGLSGAAGIYFTSSGGGYGTLGATSGAGWLDWGAGIGGLGLRMSRGAYIYSVSSSNNALQIGGSTGQSVTTVYIRAASGQTGALIEFQNSAGTMMARVDHGGNITVSQMVSFSNAPILKLNGGGTFAIQDGGSQSLYQCTHDSGAHVFRAFGTAGRTAVTMTVQGTTSQTADLFRAINISDAVQFGIGIDGKICTNQSTANTNTPSGATARQLPLYSEAGTLLGYVPVYASAW